MKKQIKFSTSLCAAGTFLILMLGLGSLTGCTSRDTAVSPSAPPPEQPSGQLTPVSSPEPSQQPSAGPVPPSEAVVSPFVQPADTQPPAQGTPSLESASQPPVQSSQAPSENGFQAVLLGNAPFFSVEADQDLTVDTLNRLFIDDDGLTAKAVKFAVVDLDGNGAPEVVLWLQVNENDTFGFEVLHQQDGQTYGHTFMYRSFMDLKQDGTFSFSSSAADSGFGSLSFSGWVYTINELASSQSAYNTDNELTISYFVGGQAASEEDYLSAVQQQSKKENAVWYDFTPENISSALR